MRKIPFDNMADIQSGSPGLKFVSLGNRKMLLSQLFTARAGTAWAAFLLMTINGIAMFLNGAYFNTPMSFCVVGTWLILTLLIITSRHDESWLTRGAIATVAFLALFWAWVGIS